MSFVNHLYEKIIFPYISDMTVASCIKFLCKEYNTGEISERGNHFCFTLITESPGTTAEFMKPSMPETSIYSLFFNNLYFLGDTPMILRNRFEK